jgi:lipoprotein-anchoring transpeptidase ErfK/SrfK
MTRSRAALFGALVVACAVAGFLAASTLASGATHALLDTVTATDTSATTTDATTTSATTDTIATTTETTQTTTVALPPVVPDGVTIAGTSVGGLTAQAATHAVTAAFAHPIVLRAPGFSLRLAPKAVGAQPSVKSAVHAALAAKPGSAVRLSVRVSSARVQRFVLLVAKRYDRKPIDSTVVLRHQRPFVSKGQAARTLKRLAARQAILADLRQNRRAPIALTGTTTPQLVSRTTFGPVIVIRNATHTLTLYNGMRFVRRLGVATGQPAYPTPNGRFQIVVMWKNPWWYPPNSPWAQGEKPVPPGPGNPLGTRWMGLSAPGVGIHGTPQPQSIGYSLSHGCIRMRIPDAEWLFEHVQVGATVFIIPA